MKANKFEPIAGPSRYCCFGGVVAGALVAGAAGLLPGIACFPDLLPAAGAATPDWVL
jgi:hypothetical protein